jgi:hypothetical protein
MTKALISEKAKCNICKRTFTDSENVAYIDEYGTCLGCDDLRVDAEQQRIEALEDLENE